MEYAALINHVVPPVRQSYTQRDAIIYALSVSAGHWIYDEGILDFLIDTRGPAILPTYAVDLGHPGFWLSDPATTVDATKVLHAEEKISLFAPFPSAGEVIGTTRIVDLVDKGPEKGAYIYIEKDVTDAQSGDLLAREERTVILRGDGGYDGPSGTPRKPAAVPDTDPDIIERVSTKRDLAFLYRLNGDPNPLHVEPDAAKTAGFDEPILHGLSTFGTAATAALLHLAKGDVRRFRSFQARFSAPVWPGETLQIQLWKSGAVRVLAEERKKPVLTHGFVEISPA